MNQDKREGILSLFNEVEKIPGIGVTEYEGDVPPEVVAEDARRHAEWEAICQERARLLNMQHEKSQRNAI